MSGFSVNFFRIACDVMRGHAGGFIDDERPFMKLASHLRPSPGASPLPEEGNFKIDPLPLGEGGD
jgi:hypothetical protein